MVTYWLPAICC